MKHCYLLWGQQKIMFLNYRYNIIYNKHTYGVYENITYSNVSITKYDFTASYYIGPCHEKTEEKNLLFYYSFFQHLNTVK
jgi:hypothetical protein